LILRENVNTNRDTAKVSRIASITINLCSSTSLEPISTMIVVMVPGPVRMGMAMGNIQTSSRFWDSCISFVVTLSCDIRACIISNAMVNNKIPPATLNRSTLIPKTFNSKSPVTAKKIAMIQARTTDRFAIAFFSSKLIWAVMDMNVSTPLIGFTTTNSDTNENKKIAITSIIPSQHFLIDSTISS